MKQKTGKYNWGSVESVSIDWFRPHRFFETKCRAPMTGPGKITGRNKCFKFQNSGASIGCGLLKDCGIADSRIQSRGRASIDGACPALFSCRIRIFCVYTENSLRYNFAAKPEGVILDGREAVWVYPMLHG